MATTTCGRSRSRSWWGRGGPEKSGRGKSGAFRIYYAYFREYGIVLLAAVFGKNEADDLSEAGKAAMATLIREIETQLESGIIL